MANSTTVVSSLAYEAIKTKKIIRQSILGKCGPTTCREVASHKTSSTETHEN